jgi:hypothetical protein
VVTETHSRATSYRFAGRARRTGTGLAVTVAAVVALAGCATGRDAQTADQVPAIDGVSATSGTLGIRGAAIQAPEVGSSFAVGDNAPLVVTLVNNGTSGDTLTGVTATSVSPSVFTGLSGPPPPQIVSASPSASDSSSATSTPSQPIPVPGNSAVAVGFANTGPAIVLTDLTAKLWAAQSVANVVFTFASGTTITATLPVQLTTGPRDAPTVDVSPTNEG